MLRKPGLQFFVSASLTNARSMVDCSMAIHNRIYCLCAVGGFLLFPSALAGAVEVQLHVTDDQGHAIGKFQAMLVDIAERFYRLAKRDRWHRETDEHMGTQGLH